MDIVSRAQWGAAAALGPAMQLPARETWLHHSVTTATGNPAADMRTLERIGVQRFGRFSYSWAVHPRGTVLEGAGTTVGAHTGGRNSFSFGIVWIGNYEIDHPTQAQIEATAELIRHLLATGRLAPGTTLTGGHRDLKATACPGRNAYPQIGAIRAFVLDPPPPPEDDMPYFAVITAPGKPTRVYVDGCLAGFPNLGELGEFLAPYRAAGYQQKDITFREADDWDRYMVSTAAIRATDGTARVLAALRGATAAVDEAEIVAGVLQGLSPEAIAAAVIAAMPADEARQVVEELGRQLSPRSDGRADPTSPPGPGG